MAGYRITFDGSLNERKNIPQSTAASSLLNTVQVSPASWDNITSISTQNYTSFSPVVPNAYTEGTWQGGGWTAGPFYAGGNVNGTIGPLSAPFFITPNLTGIYNVKIRMKVFSGSNWLLSLTKPTSGGATRNMENTFASGSTSLQALNGTNIGNFHTYDFGDHSLSNQWFGLQLYNFDFSVARNIEIDYVLITQGGAVTITPSTFVPGVAPAGGIATVASPLTITNGQSGLSNPAKLFGAKVVHDLSDILEAKYLPSADATQDADLSMSDTEFFTATTTSISVEAEGLGGPDKLRGGDTSVIVENVANTVEN